MNDSPVDCQNREWTEPQREGGTASAVTEGENDYPSASPTLGVSL